MSKGETWEELEEKLKAYLDDPQWPEDPVNNEFLRGMVVGTGLLAGAVLSVVEGQEKVPPFGPIVYLANKAMKKNADEEKIQ